MPGLSLMVSCLVAMPGMGDDRFDRTVIYVFARTRRRARCGIVINKPAADVSLPDLLVQLDIVPAYEDHPSAGDRGRDAGADGAARSRRAAASCCTRRISSSDQSTLPIDGEESASPRRSDIPCAPSPGGRGPDRALFALGYAGWGDGPVEDRDPEERLALPLPGRPRGSVFGGTAEDKYSERHAQDRDRPRYALSPSPANAWYDVRPNGPAHFADATTIAMRGRFGLSNALARPAGARTADPTRLSPWPARRFRCDPDRVARRARGVGRAGARAQRRLAGFGTEAREGPVLPRRRDAGALRRARRASRRCSRGLQRATGWEPDRGPGGNPHRGLFEGRGRRRRLRSSPAGQFEALRAGLMAACTSPRRARRAP